MRRWKHVLRARRVRKFRIDLEDREHIAWARALREAK